ncbi:sulfatase-like hydrolase/transferase [Leeuwenhoekiella polynyae]|uniref:Arylsulfatase A-like enzyme n=1 Tax=Leeuwenhoekiella polynyae TaxID=1550906 RepID=A0A4Q0NS01_9FLAO|nr:sulfatase-like hydrolase/transferase [Leeuwenhoekiella polynyae]RXG13426.1 arylsulfatase A-like enzyme [Leeuwenhoekiella polynyae]
MIKTSYSFNYFLSVIVVLLLMSACKKEQQKEVDSEVTKPNFLVIIADDAGWNDFSFHGSEIKTPVLDSLAKQGLILDRFYTYPTCSPARASFLTGRPASRMGIVAPISGKSKLKLPDSIKTFPQALNDLNYKTALMGKWHLGLQPENGPEVYGFNYSYGFLHGQLDQYAHTYKNGDSTWYKNGKFISEEGHVTDLLTNGAIEYIKEQDSTDSFYLQIAYSAPHIPLQEPDFWLEQYSPIKDSSRQAYAAAMAHMDYGIGEIFKTLKNQKLDKNTVVLFFSDNGAQEKWVPTTQYDGKYGPNYNLGSNLPLRDFKTSNYEGAIRVPAIISWPQYLEAGTSKNYLSVIDFMPTFLKWANTENIPNSVEGQNVSDLLSSENKNRNSPIYIRGHLQESVIVKPFKLIRTRHLNSKTEFELYNIEEDPSEEKNLTEKNQEEIAKLLVLLKKEFAKDIDKVNVGLKD